MSVAESFPKDVAQRKRRRPSRLHFARNAGRRGGFDLQAFRDRMDAQRVARMMRAYRAGELVTESWVDVKAELGL